MHKLDERLGKIKELQSLGLICDDGDFVPSVHYPPITQYPFNKADEIYRGYTYPEDGFMDIYIHFPFCEARCVFCHYPGKIGDLREEKSRYISYLKREIELYLEFFNIQKIRPRAILFGGGTPMYMPPEMLDDFLGFFAEKVDFSACKQYNFDVDPKTLIGADGLARLEIMKSHGVTRLTTGVQSLDDGVLKIMNRSHDAAEAIEAIHNVKNAVFTKH